MSQSHPYTKFDFKYQDLTWTIETVQFGAFLFVAAGLGYSSGDWHIITSNEVRLCKNIVEPPDDLTSAVQLWFHNDMGMDLEEYLGVMFDEFIGMA